MDERKATVDGIEMRWLESGGGGPAVVLLHGIPTSPELWRDVMPRVPGARMLAWEMVGYGESMAQGEGRDISVAKQADYLERWLRHLGIGRPLLVGHDLGGGVAQILAVGKPGLAAGLVLTNSIAYDSWPIPSVRFMRALGGLVRRLPPNVLATMLRGFFARGHDDRDIARRSADIHLARYARPGGSHAFVRQLRSLDVHDTLAVQNALSQLELPAVLVWGEADRFQKVDYGERLARDLRAPLHRIPDGRHFTPEDHPDKVAAGVREALERASFDNDHARQPRTQR